MIKLKFSVLAGFIFLITQAATLAKSAMAQDFPARIIRVIVPFAPGASTDMLARATTQRFTESWGQPAIVENRAGASGMTATQFVARAPADGYTLLMATATTQTLLPHLYKSPGYDALRDFAPVALSAWVPTVLTVHPSLPARSVKEFIALARARPGQLMFSSSGTGGTLHLAGELFKSMAQVNIVHVPYKGGAPALIDLMSGHVQAAFSTVNSAQPFVQQGRLRALGVTTLKRSLAMPDMPTIAESALPGYEMPNWVGLIAPANTSNAAIAKLNAEMVKMANNAELVKRMSLAGADMAATTPQAFGEVITRGYASMAKVITLAGVKPE